MVSAFFGNLMRKFVVNTGFNCCCNVIEGAMHYSNVETKALGDKAAELRPRVRVLIRVNSVGIGP